MAEQTKCMPDINYLRSIFDIKDGRLCNKVQRNSHTKIGELAGSYSSTYGLVGINKSNWQISRILFYMVHGYMPFYVDHIDGNKHNDHIDNLREATPAQNQANKGLSKANKSGVKGVSWSKKHSKWCAFIRYDKKQKNLGSFTNLEDAKEFTELAREMVHGKFANHGYKENISWH